MKDLFANDFLNIFIDKITPKILRKTAVGYFFICLAYLWLPLYLFSVLDNYLGFNTATKFLDDFAASTQFLLVTPLLLYALKVVNFDWRIVNHTIDFSEIVPKNEKIKTLVFFKKIVAIVNSKKSTITIIFLSYAACVSSPKT